MAKTTFGSTPSVPVEVVQTPAPTGENITPAEQLPATQAPAQPPATRTFSDDEDVPATDIKIPKLHIAQAVGKIGQEFPFGAIVLNEQVVIYMPETKDKLTKQVEPATDPVEFVVIGFRPTQYAEKLEGGDQGRLANSIEEVVKLGGTTNYDEWKATKKPLFQQLETALVLVKRPKIAENDVSNFNFEVLNEHTGAKEFWAIVQWSMKGTGFTWAAKPIKSERAIGCLSKRRGRTYLDGLWSLVSVYKEKGSQNWYQPQVRIVSDKVPAELKAIGQEFLG